MSERRFTKVLGKPGMAAHVRETVSQVVKDNVSQAKEKPVEPIDYESFIMKNRTLLQNDPQRELLLYPPDDVSQVVLPRRFRTMTMNIPSASETSHCSLLTKTCLRSYSSNWNLIHYKYSAYSGTYLDLPKVLKNDDLKEEIYEIDAELDQVDEEGFLKPEGITRQGYLLKGPEGVSDRMFVNIGSKSFKRRYCYLRQQVDGTYILELHKDEKKGESKATTIDMEFCTEVVQNLKRGRNCFELKMTGHKSYTFATENESDLKDWVEKLQQILQIAKSAEDKRSESLERSTPVPSPMQIYGTLKGLEQSVNPQLIKYGRETDSSIAMSRKENRKRLFNVYPYMPHAKSTNLISEPTAEPYREQFGQRILVQVDSLKFKLQATFNNGEELSQVEPYYTYIALFDAKQNRKLTENFYFDVNNERTRAAVATEEFSNNISLCPELSQVPEMWVSYVKRAIFSVTSPNSDIYLVLRIDKVLQGPISIAAEPYIRCTKDPKVASRVQKSIKNTCQRLGKYRMPFAWTARPLFRLYSNELDTTSDFPGIYRQEPNRLRDEDILKILSEYRKPEKLNKLVTIPGWVKIRVDAISELPENSLTTSLAPLKPFPLPPTSEPTIEIAEFESNVQSEVHPYTIFQNHLYVYPHSLQFDTQKNFSRARNIACVVELRDSDGEGAQPLNSIYGRPGSALLTKQMICSVLHHNTNPLWYDEIKIRLPINITPEHHLLFTFYHVSCELNKKKDTATENCVGYAWLPLLQKGRLINEEKTLSLTANLPPGYLSIQPLGLNKGFTDPEVTWVDGQRQLFSVGFQLISTVFTKDLHLHNLFCHIDKLYDVSKVIPASESETCKILKASHAISITSIITFFPTLIGELFKVLIIAVTEEIGLNLVRLLIHIVHLIYEADRQDILHSYVKFVFVAPTLPNVKATVHEELCRYLLLLLNTVNPDVLTVNKFLLHSGFFFQIVIKSMVQYLLATGRIKMHRNERFSQECQKRIESLLATLFPFIPNKHKEMTSEIEELNRSLAIFLKKCLTVMDRGYVFRLISNYVEIISENESTSLLELKFSFLQILCSHEHFVAFNLPIVSLNMRPSRSGDSPVNDFNLSNDFRKHHYLVGLLLQEIKQALNQPSTVRKQALAILRDLLAKHELDDRYQSRGQLARIASLYVPWLTIVLDNLPRLKVDCTAVLATHSRMSSLSSIMPNSSKPFHRFSMEPSKRASSLFKDSHLFAVIAGQGTLANGISDVSLNSDDSDDRISLPPQCENKEIAGDSENLKKHTRTSSGTTAISQTRGDKFQVQEVKDILLCFLFVVKYLGEESIIAWWQKCPESTIASFFTVIEICLYQFKYLGKKQIVGKSTSGKPAKAMTLPARMQPPDFSRKETSTSSVGRDGQIPDSASEKLYQALLEANMASEVGLLSLDILGLYCVHFKDNLLLNNGENVLMRKVFDIYLSFLQVGQSENMFRHVFAALRAFINNFSVALFEGNASLCGRLCYELLICCNSRLSTVRQESCALLYLLMRSNFEYSNRKGLNRVHLQVIISVSHMLGNVTGLNSVRFQESLSFINSYATSDKVMKGTGFPGEVKDLTKRIRTVLMATTQMREHHQDPEMLVDLQHSLANSYASTPELRHTWLATMARHHFKEGNYSEGMCCQLHIAALIAEYLKLKRVQLWGAEAFKELSLNIPKDETGLKLDAGVQDVQYTEHVLYDQLETCLTFIEKAERYELLDPLYKLIIPKYLKKRDYMALSQCHQNLSQAYSKIAEFNKSRKRLLGRYYRVAFYGQMFFEEENGLEYVYKEPRVTSLSEISERLQKLYTLKFGPDTVKIIMDSNQVDAQQLDPKYAYIQVTSVTVHFSEKEKVNRVTEFEMNHDVDTFMFETPFTQDGKVRGSPEVQWKRRTILYTKYKFPYVTKRIQVSSRTTQSMSPIEVALDEMRMRVLELEEVVSTQPTDVKKLQLRLQGSVCVQVHAGPVAYAKAFLENPSNTSKIFVEALKDVFRDFVKICFSALQVNRRVIEADQNEYHDVLAKNFEKMCQALSTILGESICPEIDAINKRHSLANFSLISGSSHTSSNA